MFWPSTPTGSFPYFLSLQDVIPADPIAQLLSPCWALMSCPSREQGPASGSPSLQFISHLHFNWGPLLPPWGLELCGRKNRFCLFYPPPLGLLRITMKVTSIGHDRPDPYQDPCPLSWGHLSRSKPSAA